MLIASLSLQVLIFLFLLLHDWVPLGALNDLARLREQQSPRQILLMSIANSLPAALAIGFTLLVPGAVWSKALVAVLYGLLFAGELFAWWIPYFAGNMSPERTREYQVLFGKTHAFLPIRHGIVPNTAHTVLHSCTALVLILSVGRLVA